MPLDGRCWSCISVMAGVDDAYVVQIITKYMSCRSFTILMSIHRGFNDTEKNCLFLKNIIGKGEKM